jgi:hypothetical protein
MAHPADFIPEIDRVLAEIKTPGTDRVRVRELQAQYRKMERAYAAAARQAWAAAPLSPA